MLTNAESFHYFFTLFKILKIYHKSAFSTWNLQKIDHLLLYTFLWIYKVNHYEVWGWIFIDLLKQKNDLNILNWNDKKSHHKIKPTRCDFTIIKPVFIFIRLKNLIIYMRFNINVKGFIHNFTFLSFFLPLN